MGELSLSASEFLTWYGISNAQAACVHLAQSGVPAVVNGKTVCGMLGATEAVTEVLLTHAWVEGRRCVYLLCSAC